MCFFFFKQKTAYEMRISDWSSDVALPISLYGSSYGICLNAAKSWFERSIEDGLAFRDKLIKRGSPAPELGEIGSSQFVCQVKKGVVTDAQIFMNAEYYQSCQYHDRSRSLLVQWNVTSIPVEDHLKPIVEDTLWGKLQEIGFIKIGRAHV